MRNWSVFVTGAAGFVGRYMVAELEDRGANVVECDIKTGADLLDVLPRLDAHRFDLVVHLAYHVGGRAAIDGSPMNLASNVRLDGALFDWALRTNQKRVLYFSSSAAYPIAYQTKENHGSLLKESMIEYGKALEPDANYGWAKLTGERMAIASIASGLNTYVVRPFSGYAADQSMDYPFPSLMKKARERKDPFEIWGDAGQTRDWIHIVDVVKGALAVVEQDVDEPVNLCTGLGTSMRALAAMACYHSRYLPEIKELKDMPMGVMHRVGDPSLFHRIYRPKVSLDWAVERAMRWTPPAKQGS